MDPATVAVYETRAAEWRERRPPVASEGRRARRFGRAVPPGAVRVDLGAGYGPYTADLDAPVVALDVADAMVRALAEQAVPGRIAVVRGDIEAPPFRPGSLGGAWANKSYLHVPKTRLPIALARLHRALRVGAPLELSAFAGDLEGAFPDDDFPGRFFSNWQPSELARVVVGAGFDDVRATVRRGSAGRPGGAGPDAARSRGARPPDPRVRPEPQRVLGRSRRRLRPSRQPLLAGRPRRRPRRPGPRRRAGTGRAGVGMTDLVKRATARAEEVAPAEYAAGLDRVRHLVAWLRPAVVCVVGLTGWRAAVDRRAVAGPQPGDLGGRPVYLMPNPSGLNAHMDVPRLAAHLRTAVALGPGRGHA